MLFPHRHRMAIGPVTASARQRSAVQRILAVVSCAILGHGVMALPRSAAWGQTVSSATITEILDSNQVFIQDRQAAVNSVAQRQQRVRTQAARVSLRFNNGAVARLGHNASLTVGQCVQLNRGIVLVSGSVNGCSTTTVAGVRGTIYTLEVTEAGETIIEVFEGEVVVSQRTDPPIPEGDLDNGDDLEMDGGDLDGGDNLDNVEDLDHLDDGNHLDADPGDASSHLPEMFLTPTGKPVAHGAPIPPSHLSRPLTINWIGEWLKEASESPQPGTPLDTAQPPSADPSPPSDGGAPGILEVTPGTGQAVNEGQRVLISMDTSTVDNLTANDYIDLVEGPLIEDFSTLPGIEELRNAFRRLFPHVPRVPSLLSVPTFVIPQPPPPVHRPYPF
ncbi:MAG: hypothetical protein VKI82_14335 [Leptolyngbya sp.]|nr:hypothetical protein [Leptolyngbya sp.]